MKIRQTIKINPQKRIMKFMTYELIYILKIIIVIFSSFLILKCKKNAVWSAHLNLIQPKHYITYLIHSSIYSNICLYVRENNRNLLYVYTLQQHDEPQNIIFL